MSGGTITDLLHEVHAGNDEAQDALFRLVYGEVRRLAAAKLQWQPKGHTLQPTALVNEVVVKLLQAQPMRLGRNRLQFFALAAKAMRSVLVDSARRRQSLKRLPGGNQVNLDAIEVFEKTEQLELLSLDESLCRLERHSERQHEIVMLHFFGGLRFHEIAQHLGVSKSTVERDWHFARAWLRREMEAEPQRAKKPMGQA